MTDKRIRAALRLLVFAALVAALFALVATSGSKSPDRVRDWVDGIGALAPLGYVVISAALTLACFPGPLLAGAGGLLFGTAAGFPLALTAAVLGASVAFALARGAGRDAAEQLAGPRLERVQAWIGARGFRSVLYARIAAGVPYSLVNYAFGLSRVRLRDFVAGTTLGAAPRAFAYVALGGSLWSFGSPTSIAAVVVLVVMGVAGAIPFLRAARARLRLRRSGSGGGSSSPAARSAARP